MNIDIGTLDTDAEFRNKSLDLQDFKEDNNFDLNDNPETLINELDNNILPDNPQNESEFNDMEQSLSSYNGSDLTPEEEALKKKNLLYKIKRFQKKGFQLSRNYDMDSDLVDLQAEVESIKREANLSAGVETMKKGLVVSTYLLEMVNNRFDPIGAKLDGWSAQVKDDVDHGDFDEIFEELYDKYTDSLDMPPEMKLLSVLTTSAIQYHIAQIIVSKTLNDDAVDNVLADNPQIKKDILNAVNNSEAGKNINKEYKMKQASDIDSILAELDIEDEVGKINNNSLPTDF